MFRRFGGEVTGRGWSPRYDLASFAEVMLKGIGLE
jgi:hypothetical protein